MAVQIIKFPKPYIEIELIAGGELTVGQTYYFIGYFQKRGGYYGQASGPVSDEISITPTSGNQSIKTTWWQDGGNIISFADAGGGNVTVNLSVNHQGHLENGSSITIKNTTNYNGDYVISNLTDNSFTIVHSWDGNDAAGNWMYENSIPQHANGIIFKWDKYSMIDAGDSKPYQWLNLNDPNNIGKDEFDESYGHRKWTARYYRDGYSGLSNTWTKEADSTTENNAWLYDGDALGTSLYGSLGHAHPSIAFRDSPDYYAIDSYFTRNEGRLLILFDETDAPVNQDDLIDAIEDSGYKDMYILSCPNNKYSTRDSQYALIILGKIDFSGSGTLANISDLNITMLGHGIGYAGSPQIEFSRCTITMISMSSSAWCHPNGTYNDCTISHLGNAFILDSAAFSNTTIRCVGTSFTWYGQTPVGANCIGGYEGASYYFQWRYPNSGNADGHLQDFYVKDFYMHSAMGSVEVDTMKLTNVEFANNGLKNKDYEIYLGYLDDKDVNFTFICNNVTSDRPDGKIRIEPTFINDPASIQINFYLYFNLTLKITDKENNVIENADVSLVWDGGSDSDVTDIDGEVTLTGLSYTIEYDENDSDGYGFNTKTSDFKTMTLQISKSGYKTYINSGFTISENEEWQIALQSLANVPSEDDVENGVTYDDGDNNYTGNLVVPSANNIRDGIGAGANGTEITGNLQLPSEDDLRDGVGVGSNGNELIGNLELPSVNNIRDGIGAGSNGTEILGVLELPGVSVVKLNETYGANGTEFTGTYLPEPAESITASINND